MENKLTGTAAGGKCYICGFSMKGSLVIIDDNEKIRHVWCMPDELPPKT